MNSAVRGYSSSSQSTLMILMILMVLESCCLLIVDSSIKEQHDEDKAAFLEEHNKVRLRAREPPLTWDPKLESYARQHARKQSEKEDCKMVHSHGPYGENIFMGWGDRWTVKDAVGMWVSERRFYNRGNMTLPVAKKCGHYTQVVWRDSIRLGCARIRCLNGNIFVVCSYDPPGNYIGQDPFTSHHG